MKRLLTILLIFALGLQPALEGIVIDTDVAQFSLSTAFTAQAKSKKKKSKKNKKKSNKKGKQAKKDKGKQGKKGNNAAASKSNTPAPTPLIGNTSQQGTAGRNSDLVKVDIPRGMVNQTVRYKAITVYFNKQLHIPNCVAYELTNTMVAMADAPDAEKRKNYNFSRDNNVPGCPDWGDYRGSGYTRGHMAPAMDMRWDKQVMKECFYMTNMCPQEAKLNNEGWRKLEESVHRWARRDGRIIVFTGPIMGSKPATIGKSTKGIAVPSAFYKVLYAPQQGRAIAFIYNNQPCSGSIDRYAVSIEEVQRRTGLQFLTTLPSATRNSLLKQCKINDWK